MFVKNVVSILKKYVNTWFRPNSPVAIMNIKQKSSDSPVFCLISWCKLCKVLFRTLGFVSA